MTAEVIVVGGVGSQPALGAGLTAVPDLVESAESHGKCLKELFDDVPVRVIEVTIQSSPSESRQVPHAIDEKLRVGDAVFLFELTEKLGRRVSSSVFRQLDVEHDFRINVDRRIQPDFLAAFEFDLLLIDGNAVWFGCELLVVVLSVRLVPVPNGLPGSVTPNQASRSLHSDRDADAA
jgi:hypothetical protein